jgi:hypothetical protein
MGVFKGYLGSFYGMEDLWGGITAKIADAVGFFVYSPGKGFCGDLFSRKCLFLKMVVLTVQAIKCTGMVEYGQISVAILGSF